MILVRLDGTDGESIAVLVLDGLPAELGALRARLEGMGVEEFAVRGATLAICRVEIFEEEGAVVLKSVDDVLVHVGERALYVTGKLDGEPLRSFDVPWERLL